MTGSRGASVRRVGHGAADAATVARLLADYHAQTEAEKIAHGLREEGPLPEGYRREIDDPPAAFTGYAVYLAERDGAVLGMVAARADADGVEVKRLWVDPAARGSGAGTALLEAAAATGDGPVRLSVWESRADALGLYESRGFTRAPSWETRPQLVCLIRIR